MIVKPSLILLGESLRRVPIYGWASHVYDYNPTLVDSSNTILTLQGLDQNPNIKDAYYRFAFPMDSPTIYFQYGESITAIPPVVSLSGTIEIFAMLEDWDPDTICWNNKPTPSAQNLICSRTISGFVGRLERAAFSPESLAACTLDMSEITGTVYGICIQSRITTDGTYLELQSTGNPPFMYTSDAQRSAAITRRSSSGTTRTLIFADGHGIPEDSDINPFVSGVTGDNAAYYNGTLSSYTVVDENTLTFTGSSFDETETDSDGIIEYL